MARREGLLRAAGVGVQWSLHWRATGTMSAEGMPSQGLRTDLNLGELSTLLDDSPTVRLESLDLVDDDQLAIAPIVPRTSASPSGVGGI